MSRPVARALFLFSSISLALLFVILMVGGLGRMVVVAEGTGKSPHSQPHFNTGLALTAGPSPTLCLTTTNQFVASPQDLGVQFSAMATRYRIELADINNDEAIDIIQAGNLAEMADIFLNDGNGHFQHRQQSLQSGVGSSIVVGDLNGDEFPDLITGGGFDFFDYPARTYLNNGEGFFYLGPQNPIPNRELIDLALSDLDGDLDLDAVAVYSSTSKPALIFWNDGAGQFTPATSTIPSTFAQVIATADLNADSAPDIVIGRGSEATHVWLNDGEGQFTQPPQALSPFFPTTAIVIGDVNGDDFPDIVTDPDEVWLNDGAGNFALLDTTSGNHVDTRIATFSGTSLAMGDINGDEMPDLLVAYGWLNSFDPGGMFLQFLNNGDGSFCLAHFQYNFPVQDIASADLDNDTDLDFVLGLNTLDDDFIFSNLYDGAYQPIWLNHGPHEPIIISGFVHPTRVPPQADVYIETQLVSGTNVSATWNLWPNQHEYQLNPTWQAPATPGLYTLYVTLTNEFSSVSAQMAILVDSSLSRTMNLEHPGYALVRSPVPFRDNRQGIAWTYTDFGDGSYSATQLNGHVSYHLYTEPGVYTVTLHDLNFQITQTSRITITDESLSGLNILAPPNLQAGQPAIFTATIAQGQPTSFTWDMGDGTMLSGPVVSHTYTASGAYTITLNATDGYSTLQATLPINLPPLKTYLPILVAAPP